MSSSNANYLEQMKMDGEELDPIDEISYFIFESIKKWYNPFEKIHNRHYIINTIIEDTSDYIFGEPRAQAQAPVSIKQRTNIPQSIENK